MKKLFFLMIGLMFFSILLSSCGQSKANTTIPTYKVSQATGLYSALAIDAEQIAVVSEEATLVPAEGKTKLSCDTFADSGLKYALCNVEVIDTGQTGWVLQMFIEKN